MRPTGQLQARLIVYLRNHGKVTAGEAGKFIQMSESCARRHLSLLCAANLAHRTDGPLLARGGRYVYFNHGPAPEVVIEPRAAVRWPVMVDPWMLPRAFFQGVAA